jgi:hypothetical protein
MKYTRTIVAVIIALSFSPAKSEVLNDIQHRLLDLSGLSPIINIPELGTTDQRNQFFDNYSVLSMPDFKAVDQIQLQNIQTFAPSHRRFSLDSLNKIKAITSGLTAQDIVVTPEDFKDISMQDGRIVVPNMTNKSQEVKDIVEVANIILQEVKSFNQKELNSLKLTISDMRNMQRVMPIIQQQLSAPIIKDGKINGVNAMTAEINSAREEMSALYPNLTFADFHQLVNLSTNSSGKLIIPNYNKETASDNLNKFIELNNQASKYIEAGVSLPTASMGQDFQMKGVNTITGLQNGFLNYSPALGDVAKTFNANSNPVLTFTAPTFNWGNNSGALLTTANSTNTVNAFSGAQALAPGFNTNLYNTNLVSTNTGSSVFEYMTDTSFATFSEFEQNPPYLDLGSLSLTNSLSGSLAQCPVCMERLRYGDLVGALEPLYENLPEGVIVK